MALNRKVVWSTEMEIDENVKREKVPWQDIVRATEALHQLKREQDPEWHPKDTAKELGSISPDRYQTVVANRLILAQNLHRPEVRQAKSEADAVKKLNKSFEREFEDELRKRQEKKGARHHVILAETTAFLQDLAPESFDVILTDPPYGIGSDKFGYSTTNALLKHEYKDTEVVALDAYTLLAAEGYRVAKPQAHLYAFCTIEFWYSFQQIFENYGWTVWPRPLIWYKRRMFPTKPDLGPGYTYECILFANKGKKPTTGLYPDVIECPPTANKNHAAEKPVFVYHNLLLRSVTPGDQVLDPFCGSGPIFPAADELGCIATGIDNDESSIAMCNERLNELATL